jgi:class 3 adenylate cyclase
MQQIDAERRMQILRGEQPKPLLIEDADREDDEQPRRANGERPDRKKRKRYNEDDTDFEMRLANEQRKSNSENQMVLRKSIDAPLVNREGHIDLFPQEDKKPTPTKNLEAERDLEKRKKEYGDQYTVRFADAAGFKQGLERPWYSRRDAEEDIETPSKDAWGNEDPRRKQRDAARIVSSDPLAMMRQGAAKVRQVEKDRRKWKEDKEKETLELLKAEKEERRRKRQRYEEDGADDFESFSLSAPQKRSRHSREDSHTSRHRHSHRHSHSERDRSREHERNRERDRHRPKHH